MKEKIADIFQKVDLKRLTVFLFIFGVFFSIGSNISQPATTDDPILEGVERFSSDMGRIMDIIAARYLPESGPESRRVIIIDVDTLGAAHVGAYGYGKNTTPFLDRFARENTVFKNAVAPATWTRASQMSVFTGTYPRTHGFLLLRHKAPDEFNTIPEEFQEAGFQTGAFTGGNGMRDGLGFEQGFDNYTDHEGQGYINMEDNLDRALKFINRTRESRSFTFIHGYDVHDPYGDTPGAQTYPLAEDYSTPVAKSRLFYENGTAYIKGDKGTQELDQQDIENLRKAYDQDLRNTDRLLKQFVQDLKEENLYENSTIIIYSSHGENLANNVYRRPGREDAAFGHLFLWPQNTQVPLIIKSPRIEPGTVESPVSLLDIGPTLYDIAGISPDPKTRRQQAGESLRGYSSGSPEDPEFSETKHKDSISVNFRGYKLIDRESRSDRLYSYSNSSFDEINMSENAEIRQKLETRVSKWRNRTPKTYGEAVKLDYRSGVMQVLNSVINIGLFEAADKPLELEKISIKSSESFKVTGETSVESRGGRIREVEATNGGSRSLEIRLFLNRSQSFAEEYISEQRQEAISVYQGAEPYGFRSGAEGCGDKFSPEIEKYDENNRVTIRFYENSEGFKGACNGTAQTQVTVYMGYCGSRDTLYRVEDRRKDLDVSGRLAISCTG